MDNFSVDYSSINKSDILNVDKYLMVKNRYKWLEMFQSIRKLLIGLLRTCTNFNEHNFWSFDELLVSNLKKPIKCLSLKNQPCKAGPTLVNINANETAFYLLIVSFNKYGGSCNKFDHLIKFNLSDQVCVPN